MPTNDRGDAALLINTTSCDIHSTVHQTVAPPMSDAYQARERAALQQLAWSTLADPKASREDKAAARARLEHVDGQYDWSRVPVEERRVALEALRKARVTGD